MKSAVIISIKNEYAKKIFSGEKTVELRKNIFNKNVKKVIIYVGRPTSKVLGEFDIDFIANMELNEMWEKYSDSMAVNKCDFEKYYQNKTTGYLIKIGKLIKYESPLEIMDLGFRNPPQNFYYFNE